MTTNRNKRGSTWSYRFVLATFTIFMVGFGFLLLQPDRDNMSKEVTNAPKPEENMSIVNELLASDWVKAILLLTIFIGIRVLVKRYLDQKGRELPACVNCGEEWPYREALKMSMKNESVTCSHCGKKQYKTRKSSVKASTLNFLIPLGILVAQFFNHILLGYFIHVTGTIWLIIVLAPYLIELQEEDPIIKPLY